MFYRFYLFLFLWRFPLSVPIQESETKVGAASRCFLLSKVYDFPHPMISSNSVCIYYVEILLDNKV